MQKRSNLKFITEDFWTVYGLEDNLPKRSAVFTQFYRFIIHSNTLFLDERFVLVIIRHAHDFIALLSFAAEHKFPIKLYKQKHWKLILLFDNIYSPV